MAEPPTCYGIDFGRNAASQRGKERVAEPPTCYGIDFGCNAAVAERLGEWLNYPLVMA